MNRRQFLSQAAALAGMAAYGATAQTTSAPTAGDSFCFCVMADPHCSEGVSKDLESAGTAIDRFFLSLQSMKKLPEADRPDFVLIAGDLHIKALAPHLDKVDIPLHATPGNHESDTETRNLMRKCFPADFKVDGKPADYYSFIHKGARFISVCDAGKGGEHVGQMCSEITRPNGQCEWLEAELAAPEPRKFLFAHIPMERDGKDADMFLSRNDSRWLKALLEQTQPTAVFFGHLHRATEAYTIGKTKVFQLRSACWNFEKTPIGYLHVRVSPDGVDTKDIITGTYA